MKHLKIGVCSVVTIIGIMMTNYSDEIRTTQKGLEIIGNAEGCRKYPYKCPADILTVGIGSTQGSGDVIEIREYSDEEIAERWKNDIRKAEECVNQFANGENLPQGAFEAATSITFNVGCSRMRYSTLFRYARAGKIKAMCDQFPRWKYAGGKVLKGLVTRREKERELCLADK
ncbi:Phage-related lysozyme (muraminidase) [Phocoenobacter uteri]|uniref:Lysozyme n=1 Tax=Phocoenobacter uteri TaxID=146806 RepID=A0A379CB99_9PAST|nr:lysozyme [Phocoenobacter uteri]MDG6880960.1 glycoside hydrolase [Phocoenobacter uteri]SUB58976.1 Phage-related lysozyme (muraminidase) [Phocoenobacter uteri]